MLELALNVHFNAKFLKIQRYGDSAMVVWNTQEKQWLVCYFEIIWIY